MTKYQEELLREAEQTLLDAGFDGFVLAVRHGEVTETIVDCNEFEMAGDLVDYLYDTVQDEFNEEDTKVIHGSN